MMISTCHRDEIKKLSQRYADGGTFQHNLMKEVKTALRLKRNYLKTCIPDRTGHMLLKTRTMFEKKEKRDHLRCIQASVYLFSIRTIFVDKLSAHNRLYITTRSAVWISTFTFVESKASQEKAPFAILLISCDSRDNLGRTATAGRITTSRINFL